MTDLYFIRHGQSVANLTEVFAGATDSPLTDLGRKQAEATAEFFQNITPDIVYASPLLRAFDTGLAVSKKFDIEIIPDDRLKEIYAGLWEGVNFKEIFHKYEKDFSIWLSDIGNAGCTEGESVKELQKRVFEAVFEIAEKNDGKKVVIATHATPIRVMECIWRKLPLDELKNIPWVSNASVTHVQFDKGEWNLISRSMDGHLEGMKTSLPVSV